MTLRPQDINIQSKSTQLVSLGLRVRLKKFESTVLSSYSKAVLPCCSYDDILRQYTSGKLQEWPQFSMALLGKHLCNEIWQHYPPKIKSVSPSTESCGLAICFAKGLW